MKKYVFKSIGVIIFISFVFVFCSCSIVSPQNCPEHIGKKKCKICGLNYFDELSYIIQSKATSAENGDYRVEAITDNVNCIIRYDSNKNTVYTYLIYKSNNNESVVFLLSMKPTTDTTYGWALSANNKMAHGTFQAEDVSDRVFRPSIENNDFTTEEFALLNNFYENSTSFCLDALHSLLSDNKNNLKISNLGFENYSPTV